MRSTAGTAYEAKIGHFDDPLNRNEDVGRREVAVNDAPLLVDVAQREAELREDGPESFGPGQ